MSNDSACLCAEDFDVVRGDSEFLPSWRLELVAKHPAGWKDLYRCPDCGQHWQVDRWEQGYTGLAIKVSDPSTWQAFDDAPARMSFVVRGRGGVSSEPCQWRSCGQPTLRGLAFCPNHAFNVMGIRI